MSVPRSLAPAAALAALAARAALAAPASAQEAPEVRLETPAATHAEPFSSLTGLRELPDGRVMVADGIEGTVAILDPGLGRATRIGRSGEGPREYRSPDGLFPLPGDSTLLVDLGNGRLAPIAADGSFGEPMPIARPGAGGEEGVAFLLPAGTDARGRTYFQPFGGGPGAPLADSAHIARFDRATGAVDTLGRVRLAGRERSETGGASNRAVRVLPRPLTPQDAWGVAPDGSVAVARSDGYRVEWIRPDGRVVRGPAVPYRPVRVGRAEKEAWLEGLSGGLAVMVSSENGRLRTTFSRGGRPEPAGETPEADDFRWPETMPPFPGGAVRVSPDGEAWVERSVPAGSPRRYDVFGAEGSRLRTVVLPPGRRLAGLGAGTVYAVRTDDLDFQWLERYRLP